MPDVVVVGAGAAGEMPEFLTKVSASQPHRANGIYVVRFRNLLNGLRHSRFIRGYGYQGGADMSFRLTSSTSASA